MITFFSCVHRCFVVTSWPMSIRTTAPISTEQRMNWIVSSHHHRRKSKNQSPSRRRLQEFRSTRSTTLWQTLGSWCRIRPISPSPLGRIFDINAGSEDCVRVVTVRTATYKRNVESRLAITYESTDCTWNKWIRKFISPKFADRYVKNVYLPGCIFWWKFITRCWFGTVFIMRIQIVLLFLSMQAIFSHGNIFNTTISSGTSIVRCFFWFRTLSNTNLNVQRLPEFLVSLVDVASSYLFTLVTCSSTYINSVLAKE